MNKVNLAGCVILKDKKILLLHRIKTDWYELPGGKIEEGETSEVAAKRELKEELQCDIIILRKIGHMDFVENAYTMGYTWFLAEIIEDTTPKIGEPDKFSDCKYISLDDLEKYKLSTNMQNFVKALKNKKIEL
jgi:8-oxo-dGTP diphosphatase